MWHISYESKYKPITQRIKRIDQSLSHASSQSVDDKSRIEIKSWLIKSVVIDLMKNNSTEVKKCM